VIIKSIDLLGKPRFCVLAMLGGGGSCTGADRVMGTLAGTEEGIGREAAL